MQKVSSDFQSGKIKMEEYVKRLEELSQKITENIGTETSSSGSSASTSGGGGSDTNNGILRVTGMPSRMWNVYVLKSATDVSTREKIGYNVFNNKNVQAEGIGQDNTDIDFELRRFGGSIFDHFTGSGSFQVLLHGGDNAGYEHSEIWCTATVKFSKGNAKANFGDFKILSQGKIIW